MFDYEKFYEANRNGVFATIDNEQVKTRVFQYLWTDEGKIFFCTGASKAVFQQLQANPHASFCAYSPEMEVASVCGKVVFVDSIEGKKRVLETWPAIAAIYQGAFNPEFQLFYLDVECVETFNFQEGPRKYLVK